MDNLDSNKKDPLKNLINASILEDAPSNLVVNVLEKISVEKNANSLAYQPVIGKVAWWIIGIVTSITFVAVLFSTGSGSSVSSLNQLNFKIPEINIPVSEWFSFLQSASSHIGLITIIFASMAIIMFFDKLMRQSTLEIE